MEDYRQVADSVAAEVAAGRLRPGDRLPPQRDFARQRGIANSTAARVYKELTRRGLTVGEVGRGTFVRAAAERPGPSLVEPAGSRIDLELNYPVVPEQSGLLAAGINPLLRPDVLESSMRPIGAVGTPVARDAVADLLAHDGWRPAPDRVLFAGNGRQAIAAAIAALVPPGARLGVEELTYPVLKAIAGRLGVTVVPLKVDDFGLVPASVEAAARKAPLKAIYLQPTLHNPLSLSMPLERRIELAGVLTRLDITAIEDTIWSFLRDDLPPLAAVAPEHTVLIDSLSKRLAPGLTVGFAVVPASLVSGVAAAVHSGGWTPMRFALDAATRWLTDGAVESVVSAKQREAAVRQEIAAHHLGGFSVRSDPRSYYCWWELPAPWRADTFVAAAARYGIAVTPAAAFAVGRFRAPNAIRLGLASPPTETLSRALATLAGLARSAPDDLIAE
ncbi:PLP-dependent aminotransferase family protein [Nocardiopsis ansamitocini]|uniref:GntR family transcriptional regulator n=1 Tax=Nocardiopsis ansamitocini TaxID=1670832 RepID=A0A9W6P8Z9_9ACTN|nr:PLP-dependent aminotransferase family protein [Nocardiopsis ansamitocini]GLU49799.1 GntR family transcriptional regulator [Nocardiopsis ansamitocini]